MIIRILTVCFALLVISSPALSQDSRTARKSSVTRESGGSVRTNLSSDVAVNKDSSLTREWITVHDNSLPVKFKSTIGITTAYESGRVRGDYKYRASYSIDTQEQIAAIEIRFLLFDVWGNHIRTLSQSRVSDIQGSREITGSWNVYSENEVSEFYASIAYIARVRTQAGRVIEGDTLTVLEEARKLSKKFSPENLEPKADKP